MNDANSEYDVELEVKGRAAVLKGQEERRKEDYSLSCHRL